MPDQWAWPLDLAPKALGIFSRTATWSTRQRRSRRPLRFSGRVRGEAAATVSEIRSRVCGVQAAVYHKPTHTLALTDAMINVPGKPTADYEVDNLRGVGADAKTDKSLGQLVLSLLRLTNFEGGRRYRPDQYWSKPTSDDSLQRGWERNVLLSLFFGPAPQSIVEPHASFAKLPGAWRLHQ